MTRTIQTKTVGRFAVAALCAAAAAMSAAPSTQAAQIGQQCQVPLTIQGASVYSGERFSGNFLYHIFRLDWFRIEGWGSTGDYYFGHAAGKANGYVSRGAFDQSTCKF